MPHRHDGGNAETGARHSWVTRECDQRLRFEGAYDAHSGAVPAYARRRTDPASAEDDLGLS
jgi:hypothetical protein